MHVVKGVSVVGRVRDAKTWRVCERREERVKAISQLEKGVSVGEEKSASVVSGKER